MKILLLEPYPNYHIRSIFNELDPRSFSVEKIYFEPVPSFRKGSEWLDKSSVEPVSFRKSIKSIINNEIVVFLGIFSPFPKMFFLFIIACFFKKQVFIASEGFKGKSKIKNLRSTFGFLSKISKINILCIGYNSNKDYYQLGFRNSNFYKFAFAENYEQYSLHDFTKDLNKYSSKDFNVLLVGRLIKRKNFRQVVAACAAIAGDKNIRKNITIQIAGEGDEFELLKRDAEKFQAISVVLHGHLNKKELAELYTRCHLFVLPSLYEGWGVVVNNAIHYGLPCLCFDTVRSGRDFLISDDENGKIVSKKDFNIVLRDLICSDSEKLKMMAIKSYEKSQLWSANSIACRLGDVFQDKVYIPPSEGPLCQYEPSENKNEKRN